VSLVAIMVEEAPVAMSRTVPPDLTADVQVDEKILCVIKLVVPVNTEHFMHHYNICCLLLECDIHVKQGMIVL
jgi:hypothetical protein